MSRKIEIGAKVITIDGIYGVITAIGYGFVEITQTNGKTVDRHFDQFIVVK
jgi:preprotein translocase subunit YajC